MKRIRRTRPQTFSHKRSGPGQPPHQPTEQSRKKVRNLSAAGLSHEQIASCIGISHPTLEKHYRLELANALSDFFHVALKGLYAGLLKGEAWAICFFLKTRGKWSERHEVTGKDGDPLIPKLENLTDEQLDYLARARRVVSEIAPEVTGGTGDREASARGSTRVH